MKAAYTYLGPVMMQGCYWL